MLRLDRIDIVQDGFRLRADWTVEGAARIVVIGPSGAGKSTLLSAIGGFLAGDVTGAMSWQGKRFDPLPPSKRPVATLFQDNNLFPHLTVGQNLTLGLRPDLKTTPNDRERVARALSEVGLDRTEDRLPATLSGGQASRAALARVMLQDRPIVLLDEPFAALGPAMKEEMLDLVAAKLAGRLVLMVTHDPADARRFGEALVFVDGGVAEAPLPLPDALESPTKRLAAYLGSRK